jgi:hypothetical protein
MSLIDRIRAKFSGPSPPMRRWTREELAAEKAALEAYIGIPKNELPPTIWMRVVDYTVQRYLPPDDARNEADWQRTRSAIEARIMADLSGHPLPPLPLAPVERKKLPPDPAFEAWLESRSRHPKRAVPEEQ